jgi:hypothetical protein
MLLFAILRLQAWHHIRLFFQSFSIFIAFARLRIRYRGFLFLMTNFLLRLIQVVSKPEIAQRLSPGRTNPIAARSPRLGQGRQLKPRHLLSRTRLHGRDLLRTAKKLGITGGDAEAYSDALALGARS